MQKLFKDLGSFGLWIALHWNLEHLFCEMSVSDIQSVSKATRKKWISTNILALNEN